MMLDEARAWPTQAACSTFMCVLGPGEMKGEGTADHSTVAHNPPLAPAAPSAQAALPKAHPHTASLHHACLGLGLGLAYVCRCLRLQGYGHQIRGRENLGYAFPRFRKSRLPSRRHRASSVKHFGNKALQRAFSWDKWKHAPRYLAERAAVNDLRAPASRSPFR
jgi:hypothetical protein